MPNIIDADGLQTATQAELLEQFTDDLKAIYGDDINLDADTPDGQWVNIMIQAVLDLQDLLTQIYNGFDPDNAIGVVLDQRVSINGIQRQAGTFSVTPIELTLSQSVNLYGLDQDDQPVFTVSDNAGNEWQLQTTQLGAGPGVFSYNFQSAVPGAVLTTPNTITVPVTIVLGVTSINNPTAQTSVGLNEESDAALRIRRLQSVSLASQGYLAGLLAALRNINGVTSAFIYENNTDATDSDGIPSHSIWVIVAGTAADEDIANAIYTKRNAGCGMYGSVSYAITQVDGTVFTVYWDVVEIQNLFIFYTATSIDGVNDPNIAGEREGLVTGFVPGVNEEVNITALGTAVQVIDPNTLVTNAGFSTALTQALALSGVPAAGQFKLNYDGEQTSALNWNDSAGTIQTALRLLTGLEACVVTGSLAGQSLSIALNSESAEGLIYTSDNTLETSAPAAITVTTSVATTPTLEPTTKRNQFVIQEANIVILPMILSPSTVTIAALGVEQFLGLGGYGALVYSFQSNGSGGSIDPNTGEYTAGGTPGTDILKVTDALGNFATATVTVT